MNRKKLLLVFHKSFAVSYGDMRFVGDLMPRVGLMNAGLTTVAALTPRTFDIEIVDENLEQVPYDKPWDLVGITGYHTQILQAREVARRFSGRGVPVVCGGPSVSISPERWRPFADVLVIGEAERIWPRFLADFLAGRHGCEYREAERFDLAITPAPDYSGYSRRAKGTYYGGIVQTSRGCPFDCEFCDVIVFVGRKMRYKPVELIIEEVDALKGMGMKFAVLADDNFSAGRRKAKEILEALCRWNRKQRDPMSFVTQLSIEISDDAAFLELAAEAGLNRVLVGIESPSEERKAFLEMLSLARASSHPQSFYIALSIFLNARNVQEMLRRLDPEVERIASPEPPTGGSHLKN